MQQFPGMMVVMGEVVQYAAVGVASRLQVA